MRKIRLLMGAGYPLAPAAAQDKREGPGVSPEAFATRLGRARAGVRDLLKDHRDYIGRRSTSSIYDCKDVDRGVSSCLGKGCNSG